MNLTMWIIVGVVGWLLAAIAVGRLVGGVVRNRNRQVPRKPPHIPSPRHPAGRARRHPQQWPPDGHR